MYKYFKIHLYNLGTFINIWYSNFDKNSSNHKDANRANCFEIENL